MRRLGRSQIQIMVKRWNDRIAGVKAVAIKLGINAKKLNRILTLEQLPDEELLRKMVELCK